MLQRIFIGITAFIASSASSFALTTSLAPRQLELPTARETIVISASSPDSHSFDSPSARSSLSSTLSSSSTAPRFDAPPTPAYSTARPMGAFVRTQSDGTSSVRSSSSSTNWDAFRAAMRRGGGGPGDAGDSSTASSASSETPLIEPTITFGDFSLWWQYDDPVTLAPVSDSDGAFTFESSHPGTLSISGDTATMGITYRSTMTITARQAAHGAYAAGTAIATVTFHTTYCVAEPCINGSTCTPTLGGNGAENFLCTCVDDHYAGVYCEESDLNCYENGGDLYCFNSGTCAKSIDGGICDCVGGFCGNYCQILPSQCGD